MAGFNIRDFSAHMNANGLMRNNKFLVRMPYPIGFDPVPALKETSRYMELWCDSTSLPGININTAEVKRYGYGPIEKMGVAPTFNNVTMTFISDRKAAVHSFFYNWTKLIANHDARTYDFSSLTGIPAPVTARPYEITYKKGYTSNIEIFVYDDNGNVSLKVTLREAFPVSMGEIQLNWTDTDDFVKIPISFSYTDFYTDYYVR
jgi:hypothetical protein